MNKFVKALMFVGMTASFAGLQASSDFGSRFDLHIENASTKGDITVEFQSSGSSQNSVRATNIKQGKTVTVNYSPYSIDKIVIVYKKGNENKKEIFTNNDYTKRMQQMKSGDTVVIQNASAISFDTFKIKINKKS